MFVGDSVTQTERLRVLHFVSKKMCVCVCEFWYRIFPEMHIERCSNSSGELLVRLRYVRKQTRICVILPSIYYIIEASFSWVLFVFACVAFKRFDAALWKHALDVKHSNAMLHEMLRWFPCNNYVYCCNGFLFLFCCSTALDVIYMFRIEFFAGI